MKTISYSECYIRYLFCKLGKFSENYFLFWVIHFVLFLFVKDKTGREGAGHFRSYCHVLIYEYMWSPQSVWWSHLPSDGGFLVIVWPRGRPSLRVGTRNCSGRSAAHRGVDIINIIYHLMLLDLKILELVQYGTGACTMGSWSHFFFFWHRPAVVWMDDHRIFLS